MAGALFRRIALAKKGQSALAQRKEQPVAH
jgi:hypothetical protein